MDCFAPFGEEKRCTDGHTVFATAGEDTYRCCLAGTDGSASALPPCSASQPEQYWSQCQTQTCATWLRKIRDVALKASVQNCAAAPQMAIYILKLGLWCDPEDRENWLQ